MVSRGQARGMMDGVWAVKYRYSSMWVGGRETKGSGRVPGFIASF